MMVLLWYILVPFAILLTLLFAAHTAFKRGAWPFSLLDKCSIHNMPTLVHQMRFRFFVGQHVLVVFSTMMQVLSWPDSELYLFFNVLFWLTICMAFLLNHFGRLSSHAGGRIVSVAHLLFMLVGSHISSRDPIDMLMYMYGMPATFALFAMISDLEWTLYCLGGLGIGAMLSKSGVLGKVSEPGFCVTCMEEAAYGLPAIMTTAILFAIATLDLNQKYLAARLRDYYKKEQQRKDEFMAILSHDIKSPLHGILGCTSLMRGTPLNALQQEQMSVIDHCGAVLHLLVENILAHGSPRDKAVSLSEVEVRPLMSTFLATLKHLAYDESIQFKLDVKHRVPRFWSLDERMVMQVLLNLGGNSIKYGGKDISILVDAPNDGALLIEIVDCGPGISPDFARTRLFQAYARDSGTSKDGVPGTGLGLSICKSVCQRMGAEIGYRPNDGGGSVFFVELPSSQLRCGSRQMRRSNVEVSASVKRTFSGTVTQSRRSASSPKIDVLIVDDNAVNIKVLSMFLKRMEGMDFEVSVATEGASALQYLLERLKSQPKGRALVFMDVQMPLMDGNSCARHWRDLEKSMSAAPACIVAVTAGLESIADASVFNAVLGKPVRQKEIAETVQQIF